MRTTIDIPDGVYRRLKAKAAAEGKSAKSLILRGVEQVLASKPSTPVNRIKLPLVRSKRPGSLKLDSARIYDVIRSTRPTGAPGCAGSSGSSRPDRPRGPCRPGGRRGPGAAPAPYSGTFLLSISGQNPILLTEVAGCFDKVIGVEYEDCYLTTPVLSQQVFTWFENSVDGSNPLRNLTLYRFDATFQLVGQLDIQDGFMRELTVSDFDASQKALGTFRLVVVPRRLVARTPGTTGAATSSPTFLTAIFSFTLNGVDGSRVSSIRGLRASWPKVPLPPNGTRHEFLPGQPAFDEIQVEMSTTGATAADLDQWVNQFVQGTGTAKDGEVEARNATLTTVIARVGLFNMSPRFFPPFPSATNRRTITLHLERFTLQ